VDCRGSDYKGTQSTTVNGRVCAPWPKEFVERNAENKKYFQKNKDILPSGEGKAACRNPDKEPAPYCFVAPNGTADAGGMAFDYCDVGCPSHKKTGCSHVCTPLCRSMHSKKKGDKEYVACNKVQKLGSNWKYLSFFLNCTFPSSSKLSFFARPEENCSCSSSCESQGQKESQQDPEDDDACSRCC